MPRTEIRNESHLKFLDERLMQKSLKVEGITCQHCVDIITDSLKGNTAIKTVGVDIDNKEVMIDYDEEIINLEQISSRITELGFEILKD